MKNIAVFLFVFVLVSCKTKGTDSIYVGGYRIVDRLIPYPYVLQQTKDSLFLRDKKGIVLDGIANVKLSQNDTLKFKKHHLWVLKNKEDKLAVFDLLDTVNYSFYKNIPNYKEAAIFIKSKESNIHQTVEEIKKNIENNVWTYRVSKDENDNPNEDFEIQKRLNFNTTFVTELTEYYYQNQLVISEHQKMEYHLFKLKDKVFISLYKNEENPLPIYQLLKTTNNELILKDFGSRIQRDKTINLQKDEIKEDSFLQLISKSNAFENCFEGYQGEYYFKNNDVTYKKGNEYLLNLIGKNAPIDKDKQNGYIIVHFNINCQQQVGDFGLIQMNRKYTQTKFSTALVHHITNNVANLKDWPNTVSKNWLTYKDVHAFLMFKIENGKITDLCP
ncbi:conserved hypothetical protein [Tenacibaculum sp. 190524A02b]|uniref:Lipoprotein n=1 Tax=Tenacibaculum vairaonense TaxID=3137860 RepID=A0ABP1F8Z1_9FLAO